MSDNGGGLGAEQLSLDIFGSQEQGGSSSLFGVSDSGEPEPILSTDERYRAGMEFEDVFGAQDTPSGFDVSISPEEAFEGVGATSSRAIGGFNSTRGGETDRFERETSPPGLVQREPRRRDPKIEANIRAAERSGATRPGPPEPPQRQAIAAAAGGARDAVDRLVEEAGWDRADAEALAGRVEDPRDSMTEPEFRRIVDAEIQRSRSSGRFAHDPAQSTLPGVDRRRTSGRFVSNPQVDTEIGRNTETGRFVDRGDR